MSYFKYIGIEKIPKNYWSNIENLKHFMRYVASNEGYKEIEDWYKCTRRILVKYGLSNNQVSKLGNIVIILNLIYENQYEFLPWKFEVSYIGFWVNIENQKWYMDWLFKKLGYQNKEDWYNFESKFLENNQGSTLLTNYNGSVYLLLKTLYPEKEWLPWKFIKTIQGFWNSIENQKWYMDWLFKKLEYKTDEDWYKITTKDFKTNKGLKLLLFYNDSPYKIIKSLYPEKEWLPWKFGFSYTGFWNSIENQKWYMDWLFKELNYETMEDWYKISNISFRNNYGGTLINKYNKYIDIFLTLYPEYNWDLTKFSCIKGEGILYDFLFQNYKDVIWGYRIDWCKNHETTRYLPFDFCIPETKSLLELDGKQHFEQVQEWNNPEETRKRDIYKMKMANENGYSVIRLLWDDVYWDKNNWREKLIESIKFYETPRNIYLNDIYKNYY